MRKLILLAVAALALLAVSGTRAFADTPAQMVVQLNAQNNSGQSGTATLTAMGSNQTVVVIDISGGSDTPQPAHIHDGTCANLDPKPKYPLTSLVNGKSTTTLDVSLADLIGEPYAVNVHKSGPEAGVYVSCGDIVAPSQPAGMPTTGAADMYLQAIALAIVAIAITGLGYRLSRRKA